MRSKLRIAFVLISVTSVFVSGFPAKVQAQSTEGTEVQQLRELVLKLQSRIEQLEKSQGSNLQQIERQQPAPAPAAPDNLSITKDDRSLLDFLRSTTINGSLDGYYGYNFNQPIGRVNLLRAYDVSSNSFSLNQANLIIERAPDIDAKRRYGLRLDFQYGQATETLQGSAANELRPQAYRPIFQAYGTYVFPIAHGLTVDFGKWASALGVESNYNKDQINYSRSYFFNFLPVLPHRIPCRIRPESQSQCNVLAGQWCAANRRFQRLQIAGVYRYAEADKHCQLELELLLRARATGRECGAESWAARRANTTWIACRKHCPSARRPRTHPRYLPDLECHAKTDAGG